MKYAEIDEVKLLSSVLNKQYYRLLKDLKSDSGEVVYKDSVCEFIPVKSSKIVQLKALDGEILTIKINDFNKVAEEL